MGWLQRAAHSSTGLAQASWPRGERLTEPSVARRAQGVCPWREPFNQARLCILGRHPTRDVDHPHQPRAADGCAAVLLRSLNFEPICFGCDPRSRKRTKEGVIQRRTTGGKPVNVAGAAEGRRQGTGHLTNKAAWEPILVARGAEDGRCEASRPPRAAAACMRLRSAGCHVHLHRTRSGCCRLALQKLQDRGVDAHAGIDAPREVDVLICRLKLQTAKGLAKAGGGGLSWHLPGCSAAAAGGNARLTRWNCCVAAHNTCHPQPPPLA